ncbi:MAG: hypothetical protein KatS3mg027_0745 [Bacteroidia bacterium]|nr:MAG: hypothetical protein KatS3mg027_0745 [Bacteroidia bacterium]
MFICLSLFALKAQQKCDIRDYYDDFIEVKRMKSQNHYFLISNIIPIQQNNCVSEFINNNQKFLSYLLTNFSSTVNRKDFLSISDSVQLKRSFIEHLKKDSIFNPLMQELNDKSILKIKKKDTVTMNEILSIAVKFFSIQNINEEGYYLGKICIDPRFLINTEPIRKPFIEAFCFSTVFKYLDDENIKLYDEFIKAIKEIYTINLGNNNSEKLLRAQGALYILMKQNEKLKKSVKKEYELQKDYLPFILVSK